MKRFILTLIVFACAVTSAVAKKNSDSKSINFIITTEPSALNCMASQRCKDGVKTINDISDISSTYPDSNFDNIADEFNRMLDALDRIGVEVFLGDKKYFPTQYRGIYSTKRNTFYLNKGYMSNPNSLIRTMRHEGWHVAQDCKAGMNNMRLELLVSEHLIPKKYADYVEKVYINEPDQIPYEREAFFAAFNKDLTQLALEICARRL
tara:strand:+ start:64 stop:684 length:621 start_codon:yes stop_codon:yes gene_type:complete